MTLWLQTSRVARLPGENAVPTREPSRSGRLQSSVPLSRLCKQVRPL